LLGVDCAELKGLYRERGLAQKEELERLLRAANTHRLDLYGRDSFGRWLVRAWADSVEVGEYMLARGCLQG
jgi:endonuclease YncB( thermonuclease family)